MKVCLNGIGNKHDSYLQALNKLFQVMNISYDGYPVFKGLQKPLEFMGIRGKFLVYAAASIGIGFVAFLGVAALAGKLAGLLAMLAVAGIGIGLIFLKQKDGLHSKRKYKGVAVYKDLFVKEY